MHLSFHKLSSLSSTGFKCRSPAPFTTNLSENEIKKAIKEVYTAFAENSPSEHIHEEGDVGCDGIDGCSECSEGCSCGSAFDPMEAARQIGYSDDELESIPEESVLGLGCGNPVSIASLKTGEIVLDLGSGAGVDVFLASKNVGITGSVIGVDNNEAMIKRANEAAKEYGYINTEFRLGDIESLPIDDSSVDVIISNCVINLSTNKPQVISEAYRVLKPGGRIMVSDMVTSGMLPEDVRHSIEAWASCIAGAEEINTYLNLFVKNGFKDVKVLKDIVYTSDYEDINEKIHSITMEARK